MTSKVAERFWKQYHALPLRVQELATKNYALWLKNPRHPSLHFKPIQGRYYSARVGEHFRAVGYYSGPDEVTWIWIGSHEEYNKFRG